MTAPRGLSAAEAAAWDRLTATVVPLRKAAHKALASPAIEPKPKEIEKASEVAPRPLTPTSRRAPRKAPPTPQGAAGLDSHWDRRFARGVIEPDFTLDLHGYSLDEAHDRLESGLAQARAMGARVVLVIAGKPRPVEAADRASRRGAIRAKMLDWLAVGSHAGRIAAIRAAHRRHGGEGALYLVLRRP